MPPVDNRQLKVLSAFARERVHALTKLTGMTASEVVEDPLRGYVPSGVPANTGRLIRRGALLIRPSHGRTVSLEEVNNALDASRARDVGD